MGIPVLILGKSGSGKSASLRNFDKKELAYINVLNKSLPFRGKFESTLPTDNYDLIKKAIYKTPKNTIVIDDSNYLITNAFMKNHSSSGAGNKVFTFYNELADNFWGLIEFVKTLPEDKIVYFFMHEDINDLGEVKPKTIGKMLDEKVCIEGLFTIVLRCQTSDGKHSFITKTNGLDVTKTPIDMFNDLKIDNDLKLVDNAIREYYELKMFVSDKESDKGGDK